MQDRNNTRSVAAVVLTSATGLRATIANLGATLARLEVPAATGSVDAILRYENVADIASDTFFLGSTAGPYANRIRDARFRLDGDEYVLEANEEGPGHCLHGGSTGLHRQCFEIDADEARAECQVVLPDGLGGFPGNRTVRVIYQLVDDAALAIDFEVTTDRDTVVSLANHAYFNLGGVLSDHEIAIHADAYTPVHAGNVPTGEIRAVSDSRYDLRTMRAVGEERFDHNFALGEPNNEPRLAAELRSPSTGLQLNVHTTQPGLQFYTGDYLAAPFVPRAGLCLEAQAFPDAPNQAGFPSARLSAGETWRARTVYEFVNTGH